MAMVSNIYKLALNSVETKIGMHSIRYDIIWPAPGTRRSALGTVVDEKLFCVWTIDMCL